MNSYVGPVTSRGGRRAAGLCLLALAAAFGVLHHRTAQGEVSGTGMVKVSGPLTRSEAERKRKMLRTPSASEKHQIIEAVKGSLIDAESARFGEIVVLPNRYACVPVNAKNRFGGYAGVQMAIAGMVEGSWHHMTTQDVTFEKCVSVIVTIQ